MKKTALLALGLIVIASPSMAESHHHHHLYRSHHRVYAEKSHHHRTDAEKSHHRVSAEKPAGAHSHITCGMVRAYVAQVGLVQARTMAQSAGMTAAEERRAIRCLENGA